MKKTILSTSVLLTTILLHLSCSQQQSSVDADVDKILSEMTLVQKVGQMAQITLDVIGNGETRHSSNVPFEIDSARIRKALVDYHIGSILNTTNNYALPPEQFIQRCT